MCYKNYQGHSVRKHWNGQLSPFSSAQWPGEHDLSCSLQASFFSLEMWKNCLVLALWLCRGRWHQWPRWGRFHPRKSAFCLIVTASFRPCFVHGPCRSQDVHARQGWRGRAPGLPSACASGSTGRSGSSPDLTAAQPSPLENCEGEAELLKWQSSQRC